MKNYKKKIIIPLVTMACLSLFTGCSKDTLVGSDAAKLLVMNERLDSKKITGLSLDLNYSNIVSKKSNINRKSKVRDINFSNGPKLSKTGTKSVKNGNTITWSTFNEYSNSISYFDSFIENIDRETKYASEIVDEVKNNIESNNVWVKNISNEKLLQVNDEEDLLIEREDNYYKMISRTINEQGSETFDIFNYTGSINSEHRVRKLGDYRYEYSNVQEDADFTHFFIADKSRGYWVIQSPINNTQFSTTIIKEDRVYDFTVNLDIKDIPSIKVITSDRKSDILDINYNTFSLYVGSLTNIDHLSMEVSDSEIANLEGYDFANDNASVLYDSDDKVYMTTGTKSPSVHLKNGKVIKPNDKFAGGKVEFSRAIASGNADGIIANIELSIDGKTLEERISYFEQFLKETNISFVRDYDQVINSIKTAHNDASAAINSISWNGLNIENERVYAEAIKIEKDKMDYFINKYEDVKDNTVISKNQQGSLDKNTTFPYITKSSFNSSYSDSEVKVTSTSLKVDDLTLFEQGKKYSIEYALAEFNDENNGYFNLIPVKRDINYTTYSSGNSFEVTSSNVDFVLPVPQVGTYELVSYIVDEEGIRVTRAQPVKVGTVESTEINAHNYIANVSKSDEGFLNVNSKLNENVILELNKEKVSYTYSELYRLLSSEAYVYGVVNKDNIEKLNESSWVKLNGNENNLTSGTYRLSFTNQNDKVVYVIATF